MNVPTASAELLRAATAQKLGLVYTKIPERPYPLWLRAGTGDLADCIAALSFQRSDGLRIQHEPQRILDIGAGAGYRSVALAEAFPAAEIIATEADPALQKVHQLNTLPYRNISSVFAAVGVDASHFAPAGRSIVGSKPILVHMPHGPVTSLPLDDLLRSRHWSFYDTVIMTPDNVSRLLLNRGFPPCVRLIAVFTGGLKLPDTITDAYSGEAFDTKVAGDYTLFNRRTVKEGAPPKLPVHIYDPVGEPTSLTLEHVSPEPWGYFPIGQHGFRLHPNSGGWAPATLSISHLCLGYRQLRCKVRVGAADAQPVKFTVRVAGALHNEEIGRAEMTVAGGEEKELTIRLRLFADTCKVIFSTQMAAPDALNGRAWAEILDPVFI
jgi:hypothetical protein